MLSLLKAPDPIHGISGSWLSGRQWCERPVILPVTVDDNDLGGLVVISFSAR